MSNFSELQNWLHIVHVCVQWGYEYYICQSAKDTRSKRVPHSRIKVLEEKLQRQIMKCLNYRTPGEVLERHRKRKTTRWTRAVFIFFGNSNSGVWVPLTTSSIKAQSGSCVKVFLKWRLNTLNTQEAPVGRLLVRKHLNYFLLPKILNIPVPQTAQTPFMARRPFFISISFASFISRPALSLHFTQYPVTTSAIY